MNSWVFLGVAALLIIRVIVARLEMGLDATNF